MTRIALLATLLLAGPAFAQGTPGANTDSDAVAAQAPIFTRQIEAKSEGLTNIITLAKDPQPDCTPAQTTPALRIVRMPAHGVLLMEAGPNPMQYPAGSPFATCNGKKTTALYVVYRSNAGYHGPDRVEVALEETKGAAKMAYDVTVK